MGYIWLQETGDGFGADVDYVLTGSAARASAELIRYRNQQSVHMREDRIARILSGPAEAAASAHSEKIPADRPAALILIGMSAAEAQADDAALKHGELANLASIHAAAYKPSAIVGQFNGDTAVIVPALQSANAEAGLRSLAEAIVRDAGKHLGISPFAAVGPDRPRSAVDSLRDRAIREALLGCMRRLRERLGGHGGRLRGGDPLPRRSGELHGLGLPPPQPLGPAPRRRELAETLRAYFDASLDVAECAQRMKLHKNTVYYRISKVSRVTGLDFGNPRHSLVALLHVQEWAGTHKEHVGKK